MALARVNHGVGREAALRHAFFKAIPARLDLGHDPGPGRPQRDAGPPDHLRGDHVRRHGLDQPDGAVREGTGNRWPRRQDVGPPRFGNGARRLPGPDDAITSAKNQDRSGNGLDRLKRADRNLAAREARMPIEVRRLGHPVLDHAGTHENGNQITVKSN